MKLIVTQNIEEYDMIGIGVGLSFKRNSLTNYWLTRIPSNLILTVVSNTEIDGAFTINGTGQDGHKVYISTDNITYTLKATLVGATATFQATALTEDTLYYFYVVAYKGANESSTSNVNFETTWATEYRTIWNALTTPPSQSIANSQAAFLKALLDGGVWSTKLDSFFFLQQTTNGASEALKDWRNLTHTGTLAGSTNPEFTANVGFLMKVADSRYIDTLFIPSTGINYTLNNASIILYLANNVATPTYDTACYDGTYFTQITLNNNATYAAICLNGGNFTVSNLNTSGLWVINRISATQVDIYHNGVKLGVTNASAVQAGLVTNSYYLGARHNPGIASGFSNGQYGILGYGGTFTLAQVITFTAAFNTYKGRALSPFVMTDHSETALNAMRATIRARIYPGGYPTNGVDHITTGVAEPLASSAAQLASIDQLTLHITGIADRTPYVWHPNTPNGKFVIWSFGHFDPETWQTYAEGHGEANLVRALINAGYTVCVINLPPGNDGSEGKLHSYPTVAAPYQTVTDLHYFIETTIRIINEYEGSFTEFYRGGHSGGGTNAAYIGALDERITKTALNCSPLPHVAMTANGMAYDWEQGLPGLDDIVEFGDLFAMATTNNRKVFQSLVYNEATFSFMTYSYVPYVNAMARINNRFTLEWDATVTAHGVSAAVLTKIVNFFNT